ncbi:MAG: site-specific DNA-methyltransferase [Armatimonadetes bacterium]|nr:site-specific DNA-methyltransferase [Armatimonadota bacterium]
MKNTLYYGDNLTIMREHIADESVDLVYLDPPFNSARDYNVLFKQAKKDENQAQITAFTDTWQWSKLTYEEFFREPRNAKLFDLMESLYRILGTSEMMAYLLMMAPRLLELHRVLKPTGSLYLHCDPTASHYLKILLDVVFLPVNFRNEVIWKRTSAHNSANRYGATHDSLLFYTKSSQYTWNAQFSAYDEQYVDAFFTHKDDEGRRWRRTDLTGPGVRQGDSGKPWRGYDPTAGHRHWQPPSYFYDAYKEITGEELGQYDLLARLDKLDEVGMIHWPKKEGGVPQGKRYLDAALGIPMQDIWPDIKPIHNIAAERMGYPTQKPLALLERIISASSNPGDIVFDPFCGCGTAVVAAEKLGRQWIGIDITYIALDLMISRLLKDFGLTRGKEYDVLGDPKDQYSAHKLFEESPKQFEIWAVGLVAGVPQPEKSGDKGVDGKVYFMDLESKLQWAVVQVKGGKLNPGMIRDFSHVIQRDKGAMGFFICLDTPTKGMYTEAEELGFFDSPSGRKIPKLQIRTIKELLEGKEFDFPKGYSLRSSGKKLVREGEQGELGI